MSHGSEQSVELNNSELGPEVAQTVPQDAATDDASCKTTTHSNGTRDERASVTSSTSDVTAPATSTRGRLFDMLYDVIQTCVAEVVNLLHEVTHS